MSEGHDDYAVEPIRGLPKALPPDEKILWQGAPGGWEVAKHVFHVRPIAVYLLALIAWRFSVHLQAGNMGAAAVATLSLLTIAALAMGLLALLSWLVSRTSVYTITSKRIVMRIGIALPTTVNLPFVQVAAAGLRLSGNGTGDISLTLTAQDRVAWSNFWPHVRPWRLSRPEPTLRGIPDVESVAGLLADAMAKALPETALRTAPMRDKPARSKGVRAAVAGGSAA